MGRRRRLGGEEDDEEGPVTISDSQSEGSGVSDGEDNASSDGQSAQQEDQAQPGQSDLQDVQGQKAGKKSRKPRKKGKKQADEAEADESRFRSLPDTEAMMNGLRIDQGVERQAAEDFETAQSTVPDVDVQQVAGASFPYVGSTSTPAVRQRREHEEYRRKRDADPAFIPNRGTFFMHDTRGHANAQTGPATRGNWQARGRGGAHAAVGGPFSPAGHFARAEQAAEQPWKHDLHDTINEEASSNIQTLDPSEVHDRPLQQPPAAPSSQGQTNVKSFSSTTVVGKVQIRVALPGMQAPISFSDVAWKHYVRLPNHRPPLRRDKPVRISIPPNLQRYIFPSPDRSFIFIPRQLRPNQQGYARGGGYQRSIGGYGYSSRRTSMYGGSMYAASIAASRRSSVAGMSRADAFSPTSFNSNRPVVRLPYGKQNYSGTTTPSGPMSGHHTPTGVPQLHTYPLPQQPTYQGTPTTTTHHPRPQKTISVTGIESPVVLQQVHAPQDHLPFQNQLPAHMNEQAGYGPSAPPFYSPRQQQQYGYPQQQHSGTPLSGVTEQQMQMSGYQAPMMPYAPAPYYPAYPPQQSYYYPPTGPNGHMPMQMYMPGPQAYVVPPKHVPHQPTQPPVPAEIQPGEPQHQHRHQPSQSGMVAHESNGMVFYLPATEAQQQASAEDYQPAEGFVPSYAMPGLPPPTPAPESLPYYGNVPVPGMHPPYYPPQ